MSVVFSHSSAAPVFGSLKAVCDLVHFVNWILVYLCGFLSRAVAPVFGSLKAIGEFPVFQSQTWIKK